MKASGRKWEIMNSTFFGTYNRTLDEKNRLSIPSKIRNLLTDKIYALKGFENCISLYNESEFEKLNEKLNSYSFNQSSQRAFIRSIYASICEFEIDKVNRISIPVEMINKYALEKDVVIVGSGNHIEVWSKKLWEDYIAKADKDFEKNAEGF